MYLSCCPRSEVCGFPHHVDDVVCSVHVVVADISDVDAVPLGGHLGARGGLKKPFDSKNKRYSSTKGRDAMTIQKQNQNSVNQRSKISNF